MTLSREHVRIVIDTYIKAWENQDPDLILSIFTEDASYHERAFQEPMRTHAGIRRYWETKVVQEQANIKCRLLSLYVDGDTAIAEWEATFDDIPQGTHKRMKEVAILDFDGSRIARLREYWVSESTPDA